MTAENWLADLEAKAKAAERNWEKKYSEESDEAIRQLEASMNFIDIANPVAILRLVGMVQWLADKLQRHTCPAHSLSCEVGCQQCVSSAAYVSTEERHD